MKNKILKTVLLLLAIVAFSLMAMGSEEDVSTDGKPNGSGSDSYELETDVSGNIVLPKNHDAYEGKDKFDVANELESYGFTNITYSPQMDLITGWLTKDGSVVSVSIDGKSSFMKNAAFAPDAPIIITYHTFTGDFCTNGLKHTEEVDKGHPATCTEDGLTDGAHCSVCQKVLKEQTVIPAGHTIVIDKAVPATQTASGLSEGKHCSACGEVLVEQKVEYWSITVENNPEFADLFSKTKQITYEKTKLFAEKYKGRIIEFDGSLDNAILHFGYGEDTADMYYSYGNYSKAGFFGPSFKEEKVKNGAFTVDSALSLGDNIHVIAKLLGYESNKGYLLIKVDKVTHRTPEPEYDYIIPEGSEIKPMPVLKGTNINTVIACAKQFGVDYLEYPREDAGHDTIHMTLSKCREGVGEDIYLDIVYSSLSNEILYATITPNVLISTEFQKNFILEMSKVLCPPSDAEAVYNVVAAYIGTRCINTHNGIDYTLELYDGKLLYYVGQKTWESWELSFGNLQ